MYQQAEAVFYSTARGDRSEAVHELSRVNGTAAAADAVAAPHLVSTEVSPMDVTT